MKNSMKKLLLYFAIIIQLITVDIYAENRTLSYNFETQALEVKSYHGSKNFKAYPVEITLEDKREVVFANILPVYVKNKGWVRAGLLLKGDEVLNLQNGRITYIAVKKVKTTLDFWTFSTLVDVADNHNYFKDGILVHNYHTPENCPELAHTGMLCWRCDSGYYDENSDESDTDDESSDNDNQDNDENAKEKAEAEERARELARRIESAKDAVRIAEIELQNCIDANGQIADTISYAYFKSVVETTNKKIVDSEKEIEGETIGDPVYISTGHFLFSDTDLMLVVGSKAFSLTRTYVSGNNQRYALGYAWASVFDSCIVRGTSPSTSAVLTELETKRNTIQSYKNNLASYSDVSHSVSGLTRTEQSLKNAYTMLSTEYNVIKEIEKKSNELRALNAYVKNALDFFTGNNSLIFINEQGTAIVFDYVQNGVWKPLNGKYAQYMRIESRDGKDSTTSAGFILYDKNGKEVWFTKWGLIEKIVDKKLTVAIFLRNKDSQVLEKIVMQNGIEITLEYNADIITAINTNTEQNVRYTYEDKRLIQIKDEKNFVSRYTYDSDGYLIKYTKPDNSTVCYSYGVEDVNNKRTSSTTNEENFTEYFDYDLANRLTVFTDYSGRKTYNYFDGQHRLIKEIDAYGIVTEYIYDDVSDNILEKSVNGNKTSYTYNSRGNVIEAEYSDGSTRTWSYNDFDQVTRFVDRDGIQQEVRYDAKGNREQYLLGDKTVFTADYDTNGNLSSLKNYKNDKTTFAYDSYYNLTEVQYSDYTERYTYDTQSRLLGFTDGENRRWSYTYGYNHTIETCPTGLIRTYTYNNRLELESILEKDSLTGEERQIYFMYDKLRRLIEVKNSDKTFYSASYYPTNELKSETIGEIGKSDYWITEYEYGFDTESYTVHKKKFGANGIQMGHTYTESFTKSYDGSGMQIIHTGPLENTTQYTYNHWQKQTGITNALAEKQERVLSPEGRLLKEQCYYGGWYSYDYDSTGLLCTMFKGNDTQLSLAFNPDRSLASKLYTDGTSTRYNYNEKGLLLSVINDKKRTFYTHDNAGRPTLKIIGDTNSIESCEEYTAYSYGSDDRTLVLDYGGMYTTYTYNGWGEIVAIEDALHNKKSFYYDKYGYLVKAHDAYGSETGYTYNALGEIEIITYPDNSFIQYEYNTLMQVEKIIDSEGVRWQGRYNEAGLLVEEVGRLLPSTTYTYDVLGRLTGIQKAEQVIQNYTYGAKEENLSFIDGKKNSYFYTNDEFGNLIQEKNRLGDIQSFIYDELNHLDAKIDFARQKMGFLYGENTFTASFNDNSVIHHVYNMAGKTVEAHTGQESLYYTYNRAGLLESQFDTKANSAIQYFYDECGRKKNLVSDNRNLIYTYGKNGELLEIKDTEQDMSSSFTYDVMMRERSRTFSNGISQYTEYDTIGRTILIKEVNSVGEILFSEVYVYNDVGQLEFIADEEGKVTKYVYDALGRLESVYYPYTKEKVNSAKKEASHAGLYYYDSAAGETLYLGSNEYTKLYELMEKVQYGRGNLITAVQGVWKESFSYDNNSNRLTKTSSLGTIEYTYDAENRLTTSGLDGSGNSFSYDKNGNLLEFTNEHVKQTFTYNAQNRMQEVFSIDYATNENISIEYFYDAFGRRKEEKKNDIFTTIYLHDGKSHDIMRQKEVLESSSFVTNHTKGGVTKYSLGEERDERYRYLETESQDSFMSEFSHQGFDGVRGSKEILSVQGQALAINTTSTHGQNATTYFSKDRLGSIKNTTDQTGQVIDHYSYDAFGTPYEGNFDTNLHYGYTGKPYDTTTGLYDYGYRDYNPQQARFTTIDPIRDGINWFSYTANDPVNFIDLWGLEIVSTEGNHKQQDFKDSVKLGNSELSAQGNGCLVVAFADVLSSLENNEAITPTVINNDTNNFTDDKSGNMDVKVTVASYGLEHDYWTKEVQGNLNSKINEIHKSDETYGVVARLAYNAAGNQHWVSLQGGTFTDEETGIGYVTIKGSSVNDYVEVNRPANWVIKDEVVHIPVSEIEKIHTIKKIKND